MSGKDHNHEKFHAPVLPTFDPEFTVPKIADSYVLPRFPQIFYQRFFFAQLDKSDLLNGQNLSVKKEIFNESTKVG